MGWFNKIFGTDVRKEVIAIKERALTSDLADIETQVIGLLGVEPYVFIAERQILMLGLVRSTFEYLDRKLNTVETRAALGFYLRITEDHFTKIPNISPVEAHQLLYRYGIAEPEVLVKIFIEQVTRGRFNVSSDFRSREVIQLFEWYLKDILNFVGSKVADFERTPTQ